MGPSQVAKSIQLQNALNGRLGMNFSIVFLHDCPSGALQVFRRPVDMKFTGNRLHEALVPFENFWRSGYPAHGQERSVGAAAGSIGISEAFPMRECTGAGDPERIERSPADGDGIRCSSLVKTERL